MEAQTTTKTLWNVDPTRSEVQFKVRHLVISTVTGTFNSFNGQIKSTNEDFDGAEVSFEIDVNSVDTNVKDRDAHLRSADFFDVEQFPKMTFDGALAKNGDGYALEGDLTLKDKTQKVALIAELGGIMEDPYGQTKAGFEINGKLNRKDFGLTWHQVTEAGGVVVGDEVKLHFNIQVVKSQD